jgi:hypothetical protein
VVAPVSDTSPLVVRWMLHAGLRYEQAAQRFSPFAQLVLEDEPARVAIAGLVRHAVALGRESMVIVNNKAEGSAPLSVAKLAEEIVREGAVDAATAGERGPHERAEPAS